MFVPDVGRGPPDPLEPDFSPDPGREAAKALRGAGRDLLSAMSLPAAAAGGDGPLPSPDRPAGGSGTSPDPEERGPDRVGDMPGGAEAMARIRRARRRELLKEGANVAVGSLVAGLVTGTVLLQGGLGPATALVAAAGAAGGWGWILGREVAADLARNSKFLERDRDVW